MDVGNLALYSWFVWSMFTPCLLMRTPEGISFVLAQMAIRLG
jgi:hypothetical protein